MGNIALTFLSTDKLLIDELNLIRNFKEYDYIDDATNEILRDCWWDFCYDHPELNGSYLKSLIEHLFYVSNADVVYETLESFVRFMCNVPFKDCNLIYHNGFTSITDDYDKITIDNTKNNNDIVIYFSNELKPLQVRKNTKCFPCKTQNSEDYYKALKQLNFKIKCEM